MRESTENLSARKRLITTKYEEAVIQYGLYASLYLLRYYEKTENYKQAAYLRDAINNIEKAQKEKIPKTVEEVEKDAMVDNISRERLRHSINSMVKLIKKESVKYEV